MAQLPEFVRRRVLFQHEVLRADAAVLVRREHERDAELRDAHPAVHRQPEPLGPLVPAQSLEPEP